MRLVAWSTLLVLTLGGVGSRPLTGQQFTATRSEGVVLPLADGRLAVLTADGARVMVGGLVDSENTAHPRADIRQGDVITRIQGLRAPTLAQIDTLYNRLEVGQEVVIGLTRGGATEHEVRFKRPPAAPGGMTVMTNGGAAGAGAWVTPEGAKASTELVIAGVHIRENPRGCQK